MGGIGSDEKEAAVVDLAQCFCLVRMFQRAKNVCPTLDYASSWDVGFFSLLDYLADP
jgi:hypothetical protein